MSRWLTGSAIGHVVMEATGIYWKPVWAVLDESFELVLANAMHVKNVPGRKTDVNDAMWLADLRAHGLIRARFIPPPAVQALRDLTRARKQLTREKRIDKVLRAANLKLASVLSDIMGESGRAVRDALAGGEGDPERLADHVHTRIRASRAQIVEAVRARMSAHQRLLPRTHLAQADAIDAVIGEIDREVNDRLEPFRDAALRLTTIPGVSDIAAAVIIAEIGVDASALSCRRPPDLLGWPLSPQRRECRQAPLDQAAQKAAPAGPGRCLAQDLARPGRLGRQPQTASYFRARFTRLTARGGPRKAIAAVAAAVLTAVYWMLTRAVAFNDLGADPFDRIQRPRRVARLVRKLAELGFDVTPRRAEGRVIVSF